MKESKKNLKKSIVDEYLKNLQRIFKEFTSVNPPNYSEMENEETSSDEEDQLEKRKKMNIHSQH